MSCEFGKSVYENAYYRTALAVELGAGAKLNYTVLNPKVILASVQNPISGLTLNERLRKNAADVILKTKEQITQGLIKGEAYEKVSQRVKGVLENDVVKARRVVRTESHRNQNQGRLDSMGHASDFGVKILKVWVTAGDGDVRSSHRSMNGRKVPMDKNIVDKKQRPNGLKKKIQRMRRRGESLREIGGKLGISKSTVDNILKRR